MYRSAIRGRRTRWLGKRWRRLARAVSISAAPAAPLATPVLQATTDLATIFEFPVCFDYVYLPILQCERGHIVCNECRLRLTSCPTCRGPLGHVHNLVLERICDAVVFPCCYSASGCTVSAVYQDKLYHEEVCDFRPYRCSFPGVHCEWSGSLEEVLPHVMGHSHNQPFEGEKAVFSTTDYNTHAGVYWAMVQSCFDRHFLFMLVKRRMFDEDQFFGSVQVIGSNEEAKKFRYILELNGNHKQPKWEGATTSVHEKFLANVLRMKCLEFRACEADALTDNGILKITVTVQRVKRTVVRRSSRSAKWKFNRGK